MVAGQSWQFYKNKRKVHTTFVDNMANYIHYDAHTALPALYSCFSVSEDHYANVNSCHENQPWCSTTLPNLRTELSMPTVIAK